MNVTIFSLCTFIIICIILPILLYKLKEKKSKKKYNQLYENLVRKKRNVIDISDIDNKKVVDGNIMDNIISSKYLSKNKDYLLKTWPKILNLKGSDFKKLTLTKTKNFKYTDIYFLPVHIKSDDFTNYPQLVTFIKTENKCRVMVNYPMASSTDNGSLDKGSIKISTGIDEKISSGPKCFDINKIKLLRKNNKFELKINNTSHIIESKVILSIVILDSESNGDITIKVE